MNFLSWYYSIGVRKLTNLYRSILLIVWDNFSVGLLLKTLFAPWKRDIMAAQGGGLPALFQAATMNFVSRLFGFMVRTVTILTGLLVELMAVIFGGAILVIFIIFPLSCLGLIYLAFVNSFLWLVLVPIILIPVIVLYFQQGVKHPAISMPLEQAQQGQLGSYLDYETKKIWQASSDLFSIKKNLAADRRVRFILTRAGLPTKETLSQQGQNFKISPEQFLTGARESALKFKHQFIEASDLLLVCYQIDPGLQQIFRGVGIEKPDLEQIVSWQTMLWQERYPSSLIWEPEKLNLTGGIGREWASGYSINLDRFVTDISAHTPVTKQRVYFQAHRNIIEEIERILSRSGKHNVILVGEAGIGKEASVFGFAEKIAVGKSTEELSHKKILALNVSALTAGAQNPQEIEARLIGAMNDAVSAGNIILYVPNIERLYAVGEGVGSIGAAEILNPYLNSDQLQLIGTTSYKAYHQFIESNSAAAANFEKIEVKEPTEGEALIILEEIAPVFENRHKILVTYKGLVEIVKVAGQYITDRRFPQKGIDLLDEASVFAIRKNQKIVTPAIVDELVSQKTEIPVGEVQVSERDKLLNLEQILHQRLVNQEEAVGEVASALRRARAGLQKGKKPIGSFLFLGPTGVGKTETAKSLAQAYYGNEKNMIRFDMSEYQDPSSVNRLIGGVGYEGGGLLSNALREQPFTLLLLDEIEKSHPNILNLFLQVLDEGSLKDAAGETVDFTNCIIIATSNAGANFIRQFLVQNQGKMAGLRDQLLNYVQNQNIFRPEFLNRFDAVVAFRPLTKEELVKVVDILTARINQNLAQKKIQIVLDQAAKEKLATLGFDPQFGARALARTMQAKVENMVANKILEGSLGEGQTFQITGDMI